MKTWETYLTENNINREELRAGAEKLLAESRAYRLREMRDQYALTQNKLAERMNISQRRISEIEQGDLSKTKVDTLRRYVEALGGQFEITAHFGDTSYRLA